jgi:hypothetical protein
MPARGSAVAVTFPGLPDDGAFSREVFQHALDRKGAVNKCEACGQDKWVVSQSLMLLQALDPAGAVIPGHGVEVVPVFCNHCGMIRLHAVTILASD